MKKMMQYRHKRRPVVHLSWDRGNLLHICAAKSQSPSNDIEKSSGVDLLSVSWADTSADQRALAATLSSLYARLQSTDGPDASKEVGYVSDRLRKETLLVWSSEVSDALSPTAISTASRVSTHSVGLMSSTPFATLDIVPKVGASVSLMSSMPGGLSC